MNDNENKMYSNLADLLNKTLENGEIPKEFAQKEEIPKDINEKNQNKSEKNLIENQNIQKKSFKIKIKKKKIQEKHYIILHKYTENIQFTLNILTISLLLNCSEKKKIIL